MENTENAENTPTTRITRLSIGRVHNLGNYENIRYEIQLDVAEGENVAELVTNLENILENVQAVSNVSEWDYNRAKERLAKPASELSENDLSNLALYKKRVADYESVNARRQKAKEALNSLGGNSAYTDAKTEWEDHDDNEY